MVSHDLRVLFISFENCNGVCKSLSASFGFKVVQVGAIIEVVSIRVLVLHNHDALGTHTQFGLLASNITIGGRVETDVAGLNHQS